MAADKLTSISTIQGAKLFSPLLDKVVSLEGIVTADFQDDKSFAGFFMQENTAAISKKRSQGIFIYEKTKKVNVGDVIRLTGTVSEHNGLTQIINVKKLKLLKSKQKLPKPKLVSLPVNGKTIETFEGMRVTLEKAGTITDHYNYIKYGEFTVSSKLLMNPTSVVFPGPQVKRLQKNNAFDRLLIDDGNFNRYAQYTKINHKSPVRIGAKVQVIGVMHYAFEQYRIQLTEQVQFFDASFDEKPQSIKGQTKIASFNVRNYFTTLDNGQIICGPLKNFNCRGADSNQEFIRQQSKLVEAITIADAHAYAIQELENNKSALKTLVAALNKKAGLDQWHYIKTGVLGEDVIRVGLIYQKNQLTPIGQYKVLDPKVMPAFEADKNRDVLLQTFKDNDDNLFNLAVVHLKSKRCSDAIGADKDQQDGQGCYNASRAKVAQQISDWLKADPTGQNAQPTIILGDFNAYAKEDPITLFEKNGYLNLANKYLSTENWTSIFRGQVGSIDHVLTNETASKAVKGMTQWHINSIMLGQLDYNLEPLTDTKQKPADYYQEGPFASSDHDMVIVGLTFSDKN